MEGVSIFSRKAGEAKQNKSKVGLLPPANVTPTFAVHVFAERDGYEISVFAERHMPRQFS